MNRTLIWPLVLGSMLVLGGCQSMHRAVGVVTTKHTIAPGAQQTTTNQRIVVQSSNRANKTNVTGGNELNVGPREDEARAILFPASGSAVQGNVLLRPVSQGARLHIGLSGLPPSGFYAVHIQEKGDCGAPDASSAGGDFNPANANHGRPGYGESHVGDLPNVKSDPYGYTDVQMIAYGATLGDRLPSDILGKAIVVYAKPDDYTSQPNGDVGARIACGVIQSGERGAAHPFLPPATSLGASIAAMP